MKHPPLLSARNLYKTYATDQQENHVLSGLDLYIHAGSFVAIMGSSGAGKSTLLHILAGLDQASRGEIWLADQNLHHASEKEWAQLRRKEMGFVFQDRNLVPNLSVWENILIAAYLGNEARKVLRHRAKKLLQQVGMEDLSHRLPAQLSGGQQQRVAIVRGLINSPSILFADEPTGNLNSASSTAVLDIFSQVHQQGQTILMVTHEVKSAVRAERILYFRDGAIIDELMWGAKSNQPKDREAQLTHWLNQKGW